MRAIVYTEAGDPSVLKLVDRDVPEPGPGQVRVRVAISGVNPTDWKNRTNPQLPYAEQTPNQDGAGTVDAVGPDVTAVAPGDRVWIFLGAFQHPFGTAAEYLTIDARRVVKLPDGVPFEVGASLGVPAMTAHRALTVADGGPDRLAPGALLNRTVLVAGGAGAVGHAAIQLARWAGATVITTVSGPEKAALATAAGAHHVVNYREGDPAQEIRGYAPDGVDVIVEVSAVRNVDLDAAVLANNGVIAIYADDGGAEVTVPVRPSMMVNARFQFLLLYAVRPDVLTAAAEDITAALRDGVLGVGEEAGLPLVRFPLERTADAHAAVENSVVGKVLIDVEQL